MSACPNQLSPCQNQLSQNQLLSYQNAIAPSQKQMVLQNLLQNLFTPNVNLVSNPTPCQNQIVLTKDQCDVCQNSQKPISRNAANPSYANRVLANPTVKTILDPNTILYNQHGVEVSRSPYNAPHVVNNYIIVPPEVFMKDCKNDGSGKSNRESRQRDKKKTGKRKKKRNRKDIDVQTRNKEANNELALLNENNIEIEEKQVEITNIPTNHEAQDEILDAQDVILDENVNNIILTGIEDPLNEDTITDLIVSQTKGLDEIEESEKDNMFYPIENLAQIPNIITQAPVSNLYNNPYIQVPMSSFFNSPCLPNNNQYLYTGADNNANYNMLDQYLQFFNNNQNINLHEVRPFESNPQDQSVSHISTIKDKHVNATDINNYNGNDKLTRRNSKNKPATMQLNRNVKPQDKEAFVIQDFKRKFPNIPENLIRDLMSHMKKHLQQEQNTATNQYPMFPMNFEQFYRTPFFNMLRSPESGRRNSNRRNNKKRKAKSKNNNDSNRETMTDKSTKVNSTDTNNTANFTVSGKYQETSNIIEEHKIQELKNDKTENEYKPEENVPLGLNKSKKVLDVNEKASQGNPDSKLFDELEDIEFNVKPENTESITIPELGNEDIVQQMPMNGVDDYYPDFTIDNHAYFLRSMEDVNLESLEDRYYYTTDSPRFPELYRERRKFDHNNNKNKLIRGPPADRNIFDHRTTDRETITPKIEQTTETKEQFRTPPTLEKPDFKTKKIDNGKTVFEDIVYKPEFTKKDINKDKVSAYSNTKTPQYNHKNKPLKVSNTLPERGNIETVFANSKVAKYGSNHGDTTSSYEDGMDTPKNSKQSDTTIVYAESIPYND